MNLDIELIYKILSPLSAAAIAAGATYFFTLRTKKHEVILAEKLKVFKLLHQKIASLKKYCVVKEIEDSGCDFAPTSESLRPEDNNSILVHRTEIWALVEENGIFLSKKSQKAIQELDSQLSLLCSMELALTENLSLKEIKDSAPGGYKAGRQAAEKCLEALFTELQ